LKKLSTDELFILSEIADKMDFIMPAPPDTRGKNAEQIKQLQKEYGTAILSTFIKKIHKAKNEIIQLLTVTTGKTADEIRALSIKGIGALLMELVQQDGVMDFFK